jgi:hypothetical protein
MFPNGIWPSHASHPDFAALGEQISVRSPLSSSQVPLLTANVQPARAAFRILYTIVRSLVF